MTHVEPLLHLCFTKFATCPKPANEQTCYETVESTTPPWSTCYSSFLDRIVNILSGIHGNRRLWFSGPQAREAKATINIQVSLRAPFQPLSECSTGQKHLPILASLIAGSAGLHPEPCAFRPLLGSSHTCLCVVMETPRSTAKRCTQEEPQSAILGPNASRILQEIVGTGAGRSADS